MFNENKIRDMLANNLELLEPGLVHIETEHKLPNLHGSKGSIDILARDSAGHRVIIELKRSDTSARSAIHELCKYVVLFKAVHGVPSHRLRCFLVSTHWHELRAPFAEFIKTSDYQAEGFELNVTPDGTPVSAKRVELLDLPEAVEFFLHHDILLFECEEDRDAVTVAVADHLMQAGAVAAFVCRLNNAPRSPQVIYPYALYAVVGGLESAVLARLKADLELEYGMDEVDSNPTLLPQEFSRRVFENPLLNSDSYEIGYPDKLATILRTNWKCVEIVRRGRMASAVAVSDAELLSSLQGLDGQNTMIYQRIATPLVRNSWADFVNAASKSLQGNTTWERDFDLFTRFIEKFHPRSHVSAKIYNPLQTPFSLSKLAIDKDYDYLPVMEIVSSENGANALVLVGILAWNGQKPVKNVAGLLRGVASTSQYMIYQHFGETWKLDEVLVQRLGLQYQSFVLKPKKGGELDIFTFSDSEEELSLVRWVPRNQWSLDQYVHEHLDLIKEMAQKLVPVSMTETHING